MARKNYIIMKRVSEASLFSLVFQGKKRPLRNGSYENSFAKTIWWWMLLYRTLRKVTCTNMRRKMYVVTPTCVAAAAVCCGAPTTDERIHAPVLHDASQIAYHRY